MSIAEKLTTIAENQQLVYDAGYAKGQAEGGGVVIDPDKIIEKAVTGTTIRVDDVSEIPHKCTVSVNKDANVTVCGKNLIDPAEYMKQSGSTTLNGDVFTTNFTSGGAYVNRWTGAKTHPAGTYTISAIPVDGDIHLSIFVYDDATEKAIKSLNGNSVTTGNHTLTFTASAPCRITIAGAVSYPGTYSYKLQLEVGTTATAYAPYNPEIYPIVAGQTIEVDSLCPTMTLFADNDATITFGYHQSWGIAQGKQAEYDRFWDAYQQNGNRNNYSYAFYGWNKSLFNPKYDFVMRYGAYYTFQSDTIAEITKSINASGATMYGTFYSATALRTITKLIVSEATTYTNTFGSATALENITFEGVIGNALSFASCSRLTEESVQSIIDHLKDLTGQAAQTLTLHATVGGKLTQEQKDAVSAKNWTLAY